MVTTTQSQIDAALATGKYTQAQIDAEMKKYGATVAPTQTAPTTTQPIAPTPIPWQTMDTSTGEPYVAPKPVIATSSEPVKSTVSATSPIIPQGDYTTMTPEQLKAQYMSIGQKLPWEITDEDRRFTKYLQTRMSLGETPDTMFWTSTSKSSGTTTYSSQLNRSPEMYQSSTKNPDW